MTDETTRVETLTPPPAAPEAGFSIEGKREVDSALTRIQDRVAEIALLENQGEVPNELGQTRNTLSREELELFVNRVTILRDTLTATTSPNRAAEVFQEMVNGETGIDVQLRQMRAVLEFRSFSQEQAGQPIEALDAEYREVLGELDSELITLQEQLDVVEQTSNPEAEAASLPSATELANRFVDLKQGADEAIGVVDALPPVEQPATIKQLRDASRGIAAQLRSVQELVQALNAIFSRHEAGDGSALGEMSEADFIQLLLDTRVKRDDLLAARDKAKTRADAEVRKFSDAAPNDHSGAWQKSLASAAEFFNNPQVKDGKKRFEDVVKDMAFVAGVSVEVLGKLVEQSDLSTFIQFLIYGGNGRTGGGMGFEGRTGENVVAKEFFEDKLKTRPSEMGKALILVHTRGLKEAGWVLSDDDRTKLEKGDSEVLRKSLVSLSKNYLHESSSNTEDRERRWNRFGRLMMETELFAQTGRAGLDITIKELIQLEGEKDPDKAWERQLGAAKPAEAAAGAGEAVTAPPPEPAAVAG